MIAWEHKTAYLRFTHDARTLLDQMEAQASEAGREGWEVVSVVPAAGTRDLFVFFKRVSPDPIALTQPTRSVDYRMRPEQIAEVIPVIKNAPICPACRGSRKMGSVICPVCVNV